MISSGRNCGMHSIQYGDLKQRVRPLVKFHFAYLILTLLALNFITLLNQASANALFCPAHAQTSYERIYCEIKISKYSGFLPTEPEFKNNMPKIQYLILKPYAQKLGIEIDRPIKKPASRKPDNQQKSAKHEQQTHQTKAEQAPRGEREEQSLHNCEIKPLTISCSGNRQYHRQLNRQLSEVSPNYLSESNNLSLSNHTLSDTNPKQLESFLTQQYKQYLQKMNEIGLIESALVWDKFTQIFFLTKEQKVSFSNRFETMFKALKKDRREGLRVKVQHRTLFNLQNCQPLGTSEVVCFEGSDLGFFVRQ